MTTMNAITANSSLRTAIAGAADAVADKFLNIKNKTQGYGENFFRTLGLFIDLFIVILYYF